MALGRLRDGQAKAMTSALGQFVKLFNAAAKIRELKAQLKLLKKGGRK